MTFYILDHQFLPTPYNFRFTVEKFAAGFGHQGWDVRVVKRIGQIREPGVVMLADHDCFHGWADGPLEPLFGRIPAIRPRTKLTSRPGAYSQRKALGALARHLRDRPEIVVIAWLWHPHKALFDELGIRVIFTGECCWGEPKSAARRGWREFSKQHRNALSLEFGAPVDPKRIGEGCKNDAIDCSYVGSSAYRLDWQEHFRADARNRIVGTPPWIDEAERVDILRSSRIVLGLHQPENVDDCLPVERVYEAPAYGAVLITDNPWAVDATDGVAQYAEDLDRARELAGRYLSSDEERAALRERGFEFARRRGTYSHRAAEFIALREKLLADELVAA